MIVNEFIELQNLTGTSVPLYDVNNPEQHLALARRRGFRFPARPHPDSPVSARSWWDLILISMAG
jgi:hypothetical protein